MSIITKAELGVIVSQKLLINESIPGELWKAFRDTPQGKDVTIFLSHSHDDQEVVQKAIVFFRKLGIRIYVDWMDSDMPAITSGTTAEKIKEKIRQNQKFILMATNNAVNSKWCNWELGLGDAAKYINDISLFPLADNSGLWHGNEYLQIYPRIEREEGLGYISEYWNVIYPNGTKIRLESWLKSKVSV